MLKELRTSHKYTQEYIAEQIGVSKKTYRSWEIGEYKNNEKKYPAMDCDTLIKIASFYNVSTDYILGKSKCTSVENDKISAITGLEDSSIIALRNCTTLYRLIINKLLSSKGIDKLVNAYIYRNLCFFQQIQVVDKIAGLTTLSKEENENYHKYQSVEFLKELLDILSCDKELFETLADIHSIEVWKRFVDFGIELNGLDTTTSNILSCDNVPAEIKEYVKQKGVMIDEVT